MVSHWLTGRKAITPERAKQIEDATGGLVKRHELRPDIFDAPAAAPVYPE
jgi:DNA-binding transcriptional regulator YdaS (Cro superfamily)